MIFAAWRLDALGMKIQFANEINHFYWDAYRNHKDGDRVNNDLEEISAINARLEDLRDRPPGCGACTKKPGYVRTARTGSTMCWSGMITWRMNFRARSSRCGRHSAILEPEDSATAATVWFLSATLRSESSNRAALKQSSGVEPVSRGLCFQIALHGSSRRTGLPRRKRNCEQAARGSRPQRFKSHAGQPAL